MSRVRISCACSAASPISNPRSVNVRNKYLQDLQAEYTKTEEDLVSAREILAQRRDALKDTKLRAPVDGIVKNIRLTTVGGVLRPSDEVLTIVPTGDELIVEAKMSPTDIAYVRIGQPARSSSTLMIPRYTDLRWAKWPISAPTRISEQTQASGEVGYYRVHIDVDTQPDEAASGRAKGSRSSRA